jgi:uncharacterized protein (TIGR03437 family)
MNPVLIRSQKCFIFTMAFVALSALSYAQTVTFTATGPLSNPPQSGVDPLGFAGKSVTFVITMDQSATPTGHTQGQGYSSSTYAVTSTNGVTFNGTGCASSTPPSVTLQDLVSMPDYVGIANCHIGTSALWAAIFAIPNGNMITAAPATVSSSNVTAPTQVQYTATPGSNCPSPCITTFTMVGSLQATGAAPPAVTPSVPSWSPSAPQGSTTAQNQIVTFSFSSPPVCSVPMTPSNPCVESYTISKSISSCNNFPWLLAATNNTAPVVQGTGNTTTGITITVDPTGIAQSSCSGSISVIYRTGPSGVSTVIPVTLTLVPAMGPPTIFTQPASQTVTVGQSATFTVGATGTGPLSYQWQQNSLPITNATSASYTTPPAATTDSGAAFKVTVTNSLGSVTSSPATLTVATPPAITMQPASQTKNVGETATFTVTATGTPPLSIQWQKNGVNIGGATSATYTTPATIAADNGASFTVVVTNSLGFVTSNPAILTVNSPPAITTQPANQTVTAGQPATFTVVATGVPAPSYQWLKNGVSIMSATAASYTTPPTTTADNGATFTVTVSNSAGPSVTSTAATLTVNTLPAITTQPANQTVTLGQMATFTVAATGTLPLTYQWQRNGTNVGINAATYTTPATLIADNGAAFTVTITNPAGSVTSAPPAILTVNAFPTITTQPANQSVAAGQTATFTVAATGSAPLSYQWQKNGTNITGATLASYTTPVTTAADNGTMFTAVVSNSLGSVTSSPATLAVNAPPTITTQPASQTVGAGQTVTFTVVATGSAPLTYQWQRNGANIVGATGSSFTTGTTLLDDGVAFTVVVTNASGSVTSNQAVLTVSTGPSITTQPADQNVTVGQTATFSVVASGTPTPSYQWQKSGSAITGATGSSYTTPATSSADNGATFAVVVTNTFGSLTSNPATLNVAASPTAITATPSQLIFVYTINGAAPASQTLTLTSSSTASFTLATSGGAWLTASPSSGSTPATITVSPNTAGLAAGTYNGTITVTPAVTTDSLVTIPVQLTVNDALKMTASPTQLSFSYIQGGAAPAAQAVNLNGISSFTAAASGAAWVSVNPASGTAPASLSVTVDPTRLNVGSYSASITVTPGFASDTPLTITVTLTVAAPSTGPAINGVFDAAGFDPDAFAPGSLISIFGARMGPDPGVPFTLNAQGKLDNTLAGVQVLVDGVPAIPLFVWNNQINAILPFTVNTSGQSAIQVVYGGATSPSFYIPLSPAGIRLFTADASGKGPGAILNRDGSPNTAATPADKGSIVSLFVAGAGLLDHPVTAGDVAGRDLYSIGLPVSATVNGADATVFYAGSAPGLVYGVYQVNVQVPANAPSGSQAIIVTAGSSTSHSTVTVFVR